MKGVPEKIVVEKIRIPVITAKQIMASKPITKKTRRRKGKMREKILRRPNSVRLAEKILGDMLPFVSGRMWRVQLMTNEEVYRRYVDEVMKVGRRDMGTDKPLGSTRIYEILRWWRIHHSQDISQCSTCKFLDKYEDKPPPQHLNNNASAIRKHNNKLNKHKNHKLIAKTQHNSFTSSKEQLIQTQSTTKMIILHDFTQLEPQVGFNQDMIVTILTYDSEAKDMIR
jgi:hypothetical protein